MKVGILALQGAFAEHSMILDNLHVEAVPVRLPSDLNGLSAIIIPGGESTTMKKLLVTYGLIEPIKELAQQNFPILGTCAGLILLAKKVLDSDLGPLEIMDIEVQRNAYGRQVDSFETELSFPSLGEESFRGVFIRAPVIQKVEAGVETLCRLNGHAVAVKQGNMLACSFHPELTDDLRLHKYFLDFILGDALAKGN
jgi:5'-phosphate synthase pdxT subunit